MKIKVKNSLEPKTIESESNNKPVIPKEIYNKFLEERMDEILEIRDKIDFNNLTYNFKGKTASVNFGKFEGPMYIYGHMKNGDTTLQQLQTTTKRF